LAGIIAALWIGGQRYSARGGIKRELYDVAIFAIPSGIIGGRLYHVITTPELYFGSHGHLINAFKIWNGGMGIWGAIALGALSVYSYFKSQPMSLSFAQCADALAPGLLVAQAIGRLGNWFNGELFGKPSGLPWAVEIPVADRPANLTGFATFTPTFLYELVWCLFCAVLLLRLPIFRKANALKTGSTFLAYIALYSFGRIWIEALRVDDAHHLFGIRLNDWVAGFAFALSAGIFIYREFLSRAGKKRG
jgi:prolipoprotein diacylglyceryl transferase